MERRGARIWPARRNYLKAFRRGEYMSFNHRCELCLELIIESDEQLRWSMVI